MRCATKSEFSLVSSFFSFFLTYFLDFFSSFLFLFFFLFFLVYFPLFFFFHFFFLSFFLSFFFLFSSIFNMKIFNCRMTGSEIGSDASGTDELKGFEKVCFTIESKYIIVGNDDIDIGANPSAEDEAEALADGGEKVLNLVSSHDLQQLTLPADKKEAKKEIKLMFKNMFKQLKTACAKDDAALASYKENFATIQTWFKEYILKNISDFDFYFPAGSDPTNCFIIPARWVGDAEAPIFHYLNDAVIIEKV
jgi:Translationally controlled tumour protein